MDNLNFIRKAYKVFELIYIFYHKNMDENLCFMRLYLYFYKIV